MKSYNYSILNPGDAFFLATMIFPIMPASIIKKAIQEPYAAYLKNNYNFELKYITTHFAETFFFLDISSFRPFFFFLLLLLLGTSHYAMFNVVIEFQVSLLSS